MKSARPWRYALASVTGTSHRQSGAFCQDASAVRLVRRGDMTWLVAAVADGAGSCRLSGEGARLCCFVFGEEMERRIEAGNALPPGMERGDAETVIGRMRQELDRAAERARSVARAYDRSVRRPCAPDGNGRDAARSDAARSLTREDFASTFAGAVIGGDGGAFLQVGDGGMVVRAAGTAEYEPVFWPQSGEYANETFFVTDREVRLQFQARTGTVDEIALFSDGLQRLVLTVRKRAAYAPFFRDLFGQLRRKAQAEGLSQPLSAGLARFLGSGRINARTDDDKTLILATRLSAAWKEERREDSDVV
jgi:hypothetical protein